MRTVWRTLVCSLALLGCGALCCGQEPDRLLGKDLAAWHEQVQSTDRQDRHEAAWALAQIGTPAWGELQAALKHADPVVRYWAVLGIARVEPSKNRGITREEVLAQLRRRLHDPAAAPRIAAAEQLARAGLVEEALPVLIAGLEDPQESVGVQAAAAFVALGKQAAPARAKLEAAAEKGGEYVKRLSTKALAQLQE